MAFQRKADTGGGDIFKFETVGTSITGVYLGSTEDVGDFGPRKKYMFKTKEGTKVVFGSTHINELLASESPGVLVRLTYDGTKPTKRGKPMKKFTLDIDDEYQASASELEAADTVANSYDDEPAEEDEAPVQTAPAKPPVNAGAPSASAKARVEGLLAKNRK